MTADGTYTVVGNGHTSRLRRGLGRILRRAYEGGWCRSRQGPPGCYRVVAALSLALFAPQH